MKYKLIREDDSEIKTLITLEEPQSIDDLLTAFKYFLVASGYTILPSEEVVVYDFEQSTVPIGTWPHGEENGE